MHRKKFSGDEEFALIGPQSDKLIYEPDYSYDGLEWRPFLSRRSFLAGLGGAACQSLRDRKPWY